MALEVTHTAKKDALRYEVHHTALSNNADGFKKPVRHSQLTNNPHNPFGKLHSHTMQTAILMH
jgi:hypothetical protein